jgi:hypothetical protein
MYSLAQKRMMAKQAGENEVVLTMEEAEAVLAHIKEQDQILTDWMDYVPDELVAKSINCKDCGLHPYECECD